MFQMFFSKKSGTDLELIWNWSGNDFVKAVPKIFYSIFFHCQFINLLAAHKDQLLAHKVHSPTPKSLSVLHRQQSTKSGSGRNGGGGNGNGGGDSDNTTTAATATAMAMVTLVAVMSVAQTTINFKRRRQWRRRRRRQWQR